jgi:FkbM family methyltransferase
LAAVRGLALKCEHGVWLPDNETHLVKLLSRGPTIDGKKAYQHFKLVAAMDFVKRRRCALDVGMHVGLWSMHLAKLFQRVVGFEPVPEHIECLRKNMQGFNNYEVHNCALGSERCMARLKLLPESTGSATIEHADDGVVQVVSLDSFEFEFVDFIKIDVEGYEKFVIQGAEATIKKHRPVLIVEQKGTKGIEGRGEQYDAINLLKQWGARQQFEIAGDFCMVF